MTLDEESASQGQSLKASLFRQTLDQTATVAENLRPNANLTAHRPDEIPHTGKRYYRFVTASKTNAGVAAVRTWATTGGSRNRRDTAANALT